MCLDFAFYAVNRTAIGAGGLAVGYGQENKRVSVPSFVFGAAAGDRQLVGMNGFDAAGCHGFFLIWRYGLDYRFRLPEIFQAAGLMMFFSAADCSVKRLFSIICRFGF